MISLKEWDRLYVHTFDWVLRRINPDSLKLYKDSARSWLDALLVFEEFQSELFKRYGVNYKSGNKHKRECIKGLELTADQLCEISHKYINQSNDYTVRYFIFRWWNELRYFVDEAQPVLDCPWEFYKAATKEEIELANKEFAHYEYDYHGEIKKSDHTFNIGKVLEYRGIRFPVDDQWGDAWFKKKNGDIRHFQLEWDWWYPIDEFLDLYNI